jgi:hypothetical protein
MKMSGLLLGVLLAFSIRLPAQVTVEVDLRQNQFLPGESLTAAVRISNRSGQTLRLGSEEDWLTFSVESRDGYVVLKTGEAPVVGEFTLESSKRATKEVDIAPYFNLSKPGRYTITANVYLKDWSRQLSSQPKVFDIIEGAKLWEREVGVPRVSGRTNQAPDLRKYTLQQANYLKKSLMLYVQVTDGSGKINRVYPLGPMLSFGQPEPEVDKLSNLHVLYQNGPHSFHYVVINTDGDVIVRQTYDYTTRPRLRVNDEGNLVVMGGNRRPSLDDLPVVEDTSTNAPAPLP